MYLDLIEQIRANVVWEKMPGDPMFAGNEEHYRAVGESALKVIMAALLLADKRPPESILDFACGTGRVTRWLRAAFPDVQLDVADLNSDWFAWTAREFDANGWPSLEDLKLTEAPRKYDLIWCGSLLTHIPPEKAKALLTDFYEWLLPDGIAVVTSHGRRFVGNLLAGEPKYLSNTESELRVLGELALNDYGYVPYEGQSYGISANTLEWFIRSVRDLNARVVFASEHPWDNHQDVLAFQKV